MGRGQSFLRSRPFAPLRPRRATRSIHYPWQSGTTSAQVEVTKAAQVAINYDAAQAGLPADRLPRPCLLSCARELPRKLPAGNWCAQRPSHGRLSEIHGRSRPASSGGAPSGTPYLTSAGCLTGLETRNHCRLTAPGHEPKSLGNEMKAAPGTLGSPSCVRPESSRLLCRNLSPPIRTQELHECGSPSGSGARKRAPRLRLFACAKRVYERWNFRIGQSCMMLPTIRLAGEPL